MSYKTVATIILLGLFIAVKGDEGDRIIGGKNVQIVEFPFQVSLQYNRQHICGGSLYDNDKVITAAHCVETFKARDLSVLTALLGTSSLSEGGVRMPIKSIVKHQYFNLTGDGSYDLAMFTLKNPVNFSSTIEPITLANKTPENGTQVYVVGWGVLKASDTKSSTKLQGVQLDFISRAACGQPPNFYKKEDITPTMICAGADPKGSCRGDSGGPMIDIKSNSLLGVVSWGSSVCAAGGFPGVYTNVVALKNWIISTAKAL
ncbi:trypsin delta-like [Episyrphus balteatus]|uniref:trypsin delta-like n=1 Tax=Episyrphus balteatus TaxID=286459 RepID=UPI002485DFEB|nr:trypsin delta-like [Episyrphus balteatus]